MAVQLFEVIPAVVQAGIPVTGTVITGSGFFGTGVNLLVFTAPGASFGLGPLDFSIDNDQQITVLIDITFSVIGDYQLDVFTSADSITPADSLEGAVSANAASIDFSITPTTVGQNDVVLGMKVLLVGVPSNQVRRIKFFGPGLLVADGFLRQDTTTILIDPIAFSVVGEYNVALFADTAETQQLGGTHFKMLKVILSDTSRMSIDGLTKTLLQPSENGIGIQVKGKNFTIDTISRIKIQSDTPAALFIPQPTPFDPDLPVPAGQFRVLNATRVALGSFSIAAPGEYGIMFEKNLQVNRSTVVSSATATVGPGTQVSFNSGFSTVGAKVGDILELNDAALGGNPKRRFTISAVLTGNSVSLTSLNPDTLGNLVTGTKTNIRVFLDDYIFLTSQPFVLTIKDTRKPAIVFSPPAQDFGGPITLDIRAEFTDINTGLPTGVVDPSCSVYFTQDGTKPPLKPAYLYPPKDQANLPIPLRIVRPTPIFAVAVDGAGNRSDYKFGFFNIGGLIDRLPVAFEDLFDNFMRAVRTNDMIKIVRVKYKALLGEDVVPGVSLVSPGWSARKSKLLLDLRRAVVQILDEAGFSLGEALAPSIIEFVNESRLHIRPGREIFTPTDRLNRAAPLSSAGVTVGSPGANDLAIFGFSTVGVAVGDILELFDPVFNSVPRYFNITVIVNSNTVTVQSRNPDLFGNITTGTKKNIVACRPARPATTFPGNPGDVNYYVLRRKDEQVAFTTAPPDGTYGVYLSPSLVGHSYLDRFITLTSAPPARAILRLAGTFTVTAGKIVGSSITNITDPVQRPSKSQFTDRDIEPGDRVQVKDIHWRELEIAATNAELPVDVPFSTDDDGTRQDDPDLLPPVADNKETPRQFMPPSNLADPLRPDTGRQLAGSLADTAKSPRFVNKTVRFFARGHGYGPVPVQIPVAGNVRIGGKVPGGTTITVNIATQTVVVNSNAGGVADYGVQQASGTPADPASAGMRSVGTAAAVFSSNGEQAQNGIFVGFSANYAPPGGFGWSTTKRLSQKGKAGPAHGGVHATFEGTKSSECTFNGLNRVCIQPGPRPWVIGEPNSPVLAMAGTNLFGSIATGTLPAAQFTAGEGAVVPIDLAQGTVVVTATGGSTLIGRSATTLTFATPSPAGSGKNETEVFPWTFNGNGIKSETCNDFTLHDFSCTISGFFTATVMKNGTQDVPVTITHDLSPVTSMETFYVGVVPFLKDGFWKLDVAPGDFPFFEVHLLAIDGSGDLSENDSLRDQAQAKVVSGTSLIIHMRPKGLNEGDVTDIVFTVILNGKPAIGPI